MSTSKKGTVIEGEVLDSRASEPVLYDWAADPSCDEYLLDEPEPRQVSTAFICVCLLLLAVLVGCLAYKARTEYSKLAQCSVSGTCTQPGDVRSAHKGAALCLNDRTYTCWRDDGEPYGQSCDARICQSYNGTDARRTDTWPCGRTFEAVCWWRDAWMNGAPE